MRVKTSSLIKGPLACLLLLSLTYCASVPYVADDTSPYPADDTRFTLKDGVIYDSASDLQWAPAPDRSMDYYQAEEYAQNLSLAGGGWRLPTRAELKSSYDQSRRGGADPKFNVSSMRVWTSESGSQSSAWSFSFGSGGGCSLTSNDYCKDIRVLVVRTRR